MTIWLTVIWTAEWANDHFRPIAGHPLTTAGLAAA
jgi:hypothetical protein